MTIDILGFPIYRINDKQINWGLENFLYPWKLFLSLSPRFSSRLTFTKRSPWPPEGGDLGDGSSVNWPLTSWPPFWWPLTFWCTTLAVFWLNNESTLKEILRFMIFLCFLLCCYIYVLLYLILLHCQITELFMIMYHIKTFCQSWLKMHWF